MIKRASVDTKPLYLVPNSILKLLLYKQTALSWYGKTALSWYRQTALSRCKQIALIVLVCLILPSTALAGAKIKPIKADLALPKLEAKAWVLMEANSGWVVAGDNALQPLPPASITKLMMNYVVFKRLASGDISFTDQVPISEQAWRAEGSRMFADVNTTIELEHLLKSTIIQSGNDAAIALAEYIGGSEEGFAQMMNKAAADIGLKDSYFENSTGLPVDTHLMSSADIAGLSATIIKEFPEYYKWYSIKEYTHNNIKQRNRNKLLWKDASVDGLKTGHTEAAGYCLVGSAKRKGQRWIAVVMGAESIEVRERAVLSLLNYAFAAYTPGKLLDEQEGITSVDVFGGEVNDVRLQASTVANIVVPAGRLADVKTELRISPFFEAPIEIGQPMGVASLSLDGEPLIDVPLTSMSSIQEGSWWKQIKDAMRLRWRNWIAAD